MRSEADTALKDAMFFSLFLCIWLFEVPLRVRCTMQLRTLGGGVVFLHTGIRKYKLIRSASRVFLTGRVSLS